MLALCNRGTAMVLAREMKTDSNNAGKLPPCLLLIEDPDVILEMGHWALPSGWEGQQNTNEAFWMWFCSHNYYHSSAKYIDDTRVDGTVNVMFES